MASKDQVGSVAHKTREKSPEKQQDSNSTSTAEKPMAYLGATLEARPNTGGLMTKRGMKGKSKPLHFWTAADVNKWLRKHGGVYYELYGDLLLQHQITGRTLMRINEIKFEKIGIIDSVHRNDLLQYFLRLRLKHEMEDLKTLNQRGSGFELKLPDSRPQAYLSPSSLLHKGSSSPKK